MHGRDADPRRRRAGQPSRGGIFSLSTPFRSSAATTVVAPPRPAGGLAVLASTAAAAGRADDDMEFRGSQTQRSEERAVVAAGNAAAAAEDAEGEESPPRQRGDPFQDGMEEEEEESDSDATTLGGSVDLLADDGDDAKERSKDGAKDGSERADAANAAPSPAILSPTSPATQTLDRLSKFGSQEGGAELCIHLLPNAAARQEKSSRGSGSNDDDDTEGGEGTTAGEEEKRRRATGTTALREAHGRRVSPAAAAAVPSSSTSNGRGEDVQAGTGLRRRQCIRELQEYFALTENSSAAASRKGLAPPAVPFCRKCEGAAAAAAAGPPPSSQTSSSSSLPHHVLCTRHPQFCVSGSYEILDLIVDGDRAGCAACAYQFDHGRPDKALRHGNGCKRANKTKQKGGNDDTHDSGKDKMSRRPGSVAGDGRKGRNREVAEGDKASGRQKQSGSVHLSPPTRKSGGTRTRPLTSNAYITPPPHKQGSGELARPRMQQEALQSGTRSDQNNGNARRSTENEQEPFEVGAVIFVQDRQWPGRNDPGGVARVTQVHYGSEGTTYDVKYVVENRKERGVEHRDMTLHSDYVSPTKDCNFSDDDDGAEECDDKIEEGGHAMIAGAGAAAANGAADAGNDADGDGAEPGPEVDENERPLSEYERLRLKNIRRNQARLAELGLLRRPGTSQEGNGRQGKAKKGKKASSEAKKPPLTERRTSKRQQTNPAEGRPVAPAAETSRDRINHEKDPPIDLVTSESHGSAADCQTRKRTAVDDISLPDKRRRGFVSLAHAAKSGCRKCIAQLNTGKVTTARHGTNCPRRGTDSHKQERKMQLQEQPQQSTKSPLPASINATLRVHRPTPSPAASVREHDAMKHQSPRPPLPTWIQEFIAEANRCKDTVPAPRGKWLPCSNPWGKVGHTENDVVVLSPFESEAVCVPRFVSHRDAQGGIPRRFVANPFELGSPYHATHRSPARGGGYSVLKATRDRLSLRPWGFTVRLHEFGGACLVDSIEPLSPAKSAVSVCDRTIFVSVLCMCFIVLPHVTLLFAKPYLRISFLEQVDISGWTHEGSFSGLKLHDMIVCINGKSVGSMTMLELQIELEVCGPELILVLSRFDIQVTKNASNQKSMTLEDLAMDWNDIGAGCASLDKEKTVSFDDFEDNQNANEKDPRALQSQVSNLKNQEKEELETTNDGRDEKQTWSEKGKLS